jgi:hypothetical protein
VRAEAKLHRPATPALDQAVLPNGEPVGCDKAVANDANHFWELIVREGREHWKQTKYFFKKIFKKGANTLVALFLTLPPALVRPAAVQAR